MKHVIKFICSMLLAVALTSTKCIATEPEVAASNPTASRPSFSGGYASKLIATIKRNIVWAEKGEIPDSLCEVEVRTDSQGNIVGRAVVRSDGDPRWCPTVVRAVDRTERIPQDIDGRVPSRLLIAFRSKE